MEWVEEPFKLPPNAGLAGEYLCFLLSVNVAIVAFNDGMRFLLRVPRSSSASRMFVSVGVPTALLCYTSDGVGEQCH